MFNQSLREAVEKQRQDQSQETMLAGQEYTLEESKEESTETKDEHKEKETGSEA